MSHAAFPGVVLAFMLTGQKSPLVLVLGAIVGRFGRRPPAHCHHPLHAYQGRHLPGHHPVRLLWLWPGASHLAPTQPRRPASGTQFISLRPGRHPAAQRRGRHGRFRRVGAPAHGDILEGVQAAQLRPRIRRQPGLPHGPIGCAAHLPACRRYRHRPADRRRHSHERHGRRAGRLRPPVDRTGSDPWLSFPRHSGLSRDSAAR